MACLLVLHVLQVKLLYLINYVYFMETQKLIVIIACNVLTIFVY